MISNIGQIMLYVDNQDEAVRFWTDVVGFQIVSEQNNGQGMKWIELSPSAVASTNIIIHDKKVIAEMSPELQLGTPSLMFYSDKLEELYKHFKDQNVTVGDLVDMPGGKVFNFADFEGNYFAVMQK